MMGLRKFSSIGRAMWKDAIFVLVLLVICVNGTENSAYELRLQGGSMDNEGRVEIFVNGEWGSICDTDWWTAESDAVCKKLGYTRGSSKTFLKAHFDQSSGKVFFYSVNCSSGMAFDDCDFVPVSKKPCSRSREVGVRCRTGDEKDNDSNKTTVVIIIVVVACIIIIGILLCCLYIRKRRHDSTSHAHKKIKTNEEEQEKIEIKETENEQMKTQGEEVAMKDV